MGLISWLSILNWLALPLVVLGIILIRWGRYPRRRGSERRCRKCEYDLTGIESERCPECGATLTFKTIVLGHRQRRAGVWVLGLLMLLLGIAAPIPSAYRRLARVNWYPYKPTSWLISELGPPTGRTSRRALEELLKREQAGRFSVGQERRLLERALVDPSGQDVEVVRQLSNYAGRQLAAGKMTDAQRPIFFNRSMQVFLYPKLVVAAGDPVPFYVSFFKSLPATWSARARDVRVMIDGKVVLNREAMIPIGGGLGGAYSMGWPVQFNEPGDHKMEVLATYDIFDEAGKLLHSQDAIAIGTFKIVDPTLVAPLKVSSDSALLGALQRSLRPDKFEFNLAGTKVLTGRVWTEKSPTDTAFEVWAHWEGHKIKLGGVVSAVNGGDGLDRVNSAPLGDVVPPPMIDIVLRGTEQAARESVNASGVWKGEVVFNNVPVTIVPDKKP